MNAQQATSRALSLADTPYQQSGARVDITEPTPREEHVYFSEAYAGSIRRMLIDQGKTVSLMSYDTSREMFVFDVY